MDINKGFEYFKTRAMAMHGDKFDYSEVGFVNQKLPIKIICPDHGAFYQRAELHIRKGSKGCPKCWESVRKEVSKNRKTNFIKPNATENYFLSKANKKFKNKFKYDLTNYNGITKNQIKIICPTHGEFIVQPCVHLISATGCYKCGMEKKNQSKTYEYEQTIKSCHKKHSYQYEYPIYNKTTYKNRKSSIDIICSKHGSFKMKAEHHLRGCACFQCKVEEMISNNILVGGYSEKLFEEKPLLINIPAVLYYLEINHGQYYKIGITRVSTRSRIKGLLSKSKGKITHVKILSEKNDTLYNCFKREQQLLETFKDSRTYLFWSTEVFSKDVLQASNYML